ncbi:MAG: hypothetical protein BWK73_29775 [Thiothrix lacustris]|uniref:Uncharacterized protein n=1 Tax=Thiothrix lacustris TaxID=525917 RepID=A0A1Y1QJE2_9GAMM|nr:MAG: hypothetical protein BWK73_29775 [Thiothrix lacustris]
MKQSNITPSAYYLLLLTLPPLSGCEQRDTAPPQPTPPIESVAEPVIIPNADKLQPDPSTAVETQAVAPESNAMPPDKPNTLKIPNFAQQTTPDNELALRFLATGESFYTEIALANGILSYTYFEDTTGRCAQWVKSSPCWQQSDLKTISMALTSEDLDNLYAVVKDSGILTLKRATFGDAKAGQRHYDQRLEVSIDGTSKKLVYQHFPGASKKPEAFARLETALLAYANDLPH